MKRLHVAALGCVLAACALALGCGDEPAAGDNGNRAMIVAAPMCIANGMSACPCPGMAGVMGSQLCAPDGRSFGACTGCPAPGATTGGNGGGGGSAAGAGTAGAGGAAGVGGAAGSDSGVTGAGGSAGAVGGAGMAGAAGGGGSVSTSLDVIAAEPGTSCGVGLVSLCALDTEKCCARSLETDTCIPAAEACECDLPNCSVMEASCDGPEDCAMGEVCCGTLGNGSASYAGFECATQCDNQGTQREACHQDMTECPGSLVCANSQLLTNVQVCIDPATIQQ